MTNAADLEDQALAELLEFGRFALREAQARIATADDDAAFASLMQAGMRAARSLRQTLALHDRRRRERRAAEAQARDQADRAATQATEARKAQIRAHLTYGISREADGAEAEKLDADLEELLDIEALDDAFLQVPIQRQVDTFIQRLGLVAPPMAELSAKPPEGVLPEHAAPPGAHPEQGFRESDPARRSSA